MQKSAAGGGGGATGRNKKRPSTLRLGQVAAIALKRANPTSHRGLAEQVRRAEEQRIWAVAMAERFGRGDGDRGDAAGGTSAGAPSPLVQSPEELAHWYRQHVGQYVATALAAGRSLWPAQRRMIEAMRQREEEPLEAGVRGAVLCFPPGKGKTRAVLEWVLEDKLALIEQHGTEARFRHPTIVVVPKSLATQWHRELRKYYPPQVLSVLWIRGREAAEQALAVDVAQLLHCIDLVLLTYDMVKGAYGGVDGERRGIFAVAWRRVVLDEAHLVVNEDTQAFQSATQLRAERRILVTATPFPNSQTQELNAILRFLGSTEQLPDTLDHAETAAAVPVEVARRRRLIEQYFLRPSEAEAEEDPRPVVVRVDLHPEVERPQYEQLAAQHAARADNEMALRTKLRKLCVSPVLLQPKEQWDPTRAPSSRIAAVLHYLAERLAPNEKALVFCEWLKPLYELKHHLDRRQISNVLVRGTMDVPTRTEIFDRIMDEGADPRVALLPLKIGAFGLNFHRANHVIILAGHYHPCAEVQAFGRINRPEQTRPMHFVKFVTPGTIDEWILNINETKDQRKRDMMWRHAPSSA